ncbi:MAG: metallophosphoesterase family protein [Acutalibacteraceae bacterium]
MKILVFSDSHGEYTAMKAAIRRQTAAEVVLFCGDGEEDIDCVKREFPDKMFVAVRGNCDWGSSLPYSETLFLEGKKIFMTHGHLYKVKMYYEEIINHAHEIGADILLFGHTHTAYTDYDDGLYIMNPGSASGYSATYGIIDITKAGIMTNVVPLPRV